VLALSSPSGWTLPNVQASGILMGTLPSVGHGLKWLGAKNIISFDNLKYNTRDLIEILGDYRRTYFLVFVRGTGSRLILSDHMLRLSVGDYPLRRGADIICGVLAIGSVCGGRSPSAGIGPSIVVDDRLLLERDFLRKVWLEGRESLSADSSSQRKHHFVVEKI